MKLTRKSTLREIEKAISDAALHRSATHNKGQPSYAFALGSLEYLLASLALGSPKVLSRVNDYIAQSEMGEVTAAAA